MPVYSKIRNAISIKINQHIPFIPLGQRILITGVICIFSGLGFLFILLPLNSPAYAASEVLIKSGADSKHRNLMKCIKINKNDISNCIDDFIQYLKADISLIKIAKNKGKHKKRLDKMVNYLKKSTDHFYAKAQKEDKLSYYQKASKCASLLVNLSDKYKDYKKVVAAYKKAKDKFSVTGTLDALYRKLKKLKYPSGDFKSSFSNLVKKVKQGYTNLDQTLKTNMKKLGDDLSARFLNHLQSISTALGGRKDPNYSLMNNRFKIYKTGAKIPNVEPEKEKIVSLRKKIGGQIGDVFNELRSVQETAGEDYLGNRYGKLDESSVYLKKLQNIASNSLDTAKKTGELFIGTPNIPAKQLTSLSEKTDFLLTVNLAIKQMKKEEYGSAVKSVDKALSMKTVSKNLKNKGTKDRINIIDTGISESIKKGNQLIVTKKFYDSLAKIKPIHSLPLNNKHKTLITKFEDKLVDGIIRHSKALRKEKKYWDAANLLSGVSSLPLNTGQKGKIRAFMYKLIENLGYKRGMKEQAIDALIGK